jgi:hypothetical protein
MNELKFNRLLETGEFEKMFAENRINDLLNSGELTSKQMQRLVDLSKEMSKEELQRRQYELAKEPGYAEYVLAPLIRKIQEQQNKVTKDSEGVNVDNVSEIMSKKTTTDTKDIVTGLSKRKKTVKEAPVAPNTPNKIGNVNANFYADAVSASKPKMRIANSPTNIGEKIYAVMKQDIDDRRLRSELSKNKEEEQFEEDKRRHEELIKAINKAKAGAKPVKAKKEPTPTKTEAPAPKPTEAPKPAPKTTEAPKPAPKPAEAPAPKPTTATKPPAEAPAAPSAVKPVAPETTGKVITAAKVATIGAAVGVGLIGKEALAENISKYESRGDYNAYNKGTVGNKIVGSDKAIDFSKMTISEYLERGKLKPGDPNRLFAVGRYQIIPKTMEGLIKKLDIDPSKTYLDKDTQDKLFSNGLVGVVRKKVDDYINGRSEDRDAAILELAQEFASVGIPKDMQIGNKKLKRGDSYYSGIGGNVAHNSPDDVGKALDVDRAKNLKSKTTDVNLETNMGSKISESSIENKDLKTKNNATNVAIDNTKTNIISSGGSAPQTIRTPTPSERPAIIGG